MKMYTDDNLLLRQLPYFRDFQPENLALVLRHACRRDLVTGEIIMLEGEPAEALYMVRRGRVRVFRSTADGREQVLFLLGPGTTFNDTAVFDGGTNLANAQAIDPGTSICVLPVFLLTHLLATNPVMGTRVVSVLTGHVRQLAALVEDLSLCHATHRVAKLLEEEGAGTGMVLLSRQEIATRVGTVREVVSRALHQLEQAGAVTRQDKRTLRVDTQMLHTLRATETVARARAVVAL
jgi:CRP/FNR family cyclic AMP-dependent transcriptional regulator